MTEKEWKHRIAITLRQKMLDANITQLELARKSHISQGAISNYLNARTIPDIRAIINLSIVLKCKVSNLADFGEKIE